MTSWGVGVGLAETVSGRYGSDMMPTETPEETTDPRTPLEKRSDVELRWRLARLKTLRWKEAAGHFVLIVVGVLVALFVDALRQRQNEREREAAYIADLRADMDSTLKSIDRSIGVNRESLGRAETMLRYLQSVDDVPEDWDYARSLPNR
jgi:hypothetical protein